MNTLILDILTRINFYKKAFVAVCIEGFYKGKTELLSRFPLFRKFVVKSVGMLRRLNIYRAQTTFLKIRKYDCPYIPFKWEPMNWNQRQLQAKRDV